MDYKKFSVNLDPYNVAIDLRNYYLARGFSDIKFLESFGAWYSKVLNSPISKLEDCYLKVCFISASVLEDKYKNLKLFLYLSIFWNIFFVLYYLFCI